MPRSGSFFKSAAALGTLAQGEHLKNCSKAKKTVYISCGILAHVLELLLSVVSRYNLLLEKIKSQGTWLSVLDRLLSFRSGLSDHPPSRLQSPLSR